jgi:hypothetical protein
MAYQHYISALVNPERPLPPGFAVRLPRAGLDHLPDPGNMNDWVYFDDCRLSDGTMIDAKGTGYLGMLNKGSDDFPWKGVVAKMREQAEDQIEAAGARRIEWYFAEEPVAEYVREKFIIAKVPIIVIVEPPPW